MATMLPSLRQVPPVRGVFAAKHLAELARQALVAEAVLRVGAVAEGLALRPAATAQRDLVDRRALAAVRPAQIRDGVRGLSVDQVIRTVRCAGDLRLGAHGDILNLATRSAFRGASQIRVRPPQCFGPNRSRASD